MIAPSLIEKAAKEIQESARVCSVLLYARNIAREALTAAIGPCVVELEELDAAFKWYEDQAGCPLLTAVFDAAKAYRALFEDGGE